ncbi:MAG TPA: heparin lyase I family protein, partial [Myxococcaceae bacterium]
HIKWSANQNVGFVELWYDGKLVVPKRFVQTLYGSGDTNYLKMGLYRDAQTDPTQVLFHDGVVQATTYEEAAPNARPDPNPDPTPGPPPGPPDASPPPAPAPGDGSGAANPSSGEGQVLPQEQTGGCNVGATSAFSVSAALAALTPLLRRRRRSR